MTFWEAITNDKEILGYIKGFKITFEEELKESIFKPEFNFNKEEKEYIRGEIETFLSKGIIIRVPNEEAVTTDTVQFVTNIFLRNKPDATFRTILNLKQLNEYVKKIHFKMETFKSTLRLIRRNCYFAKIDLKDAYYSVPIDDEYKRFFRFRFENIMYEFQCMPQGYTDAPRLFTKLTKPLLSLLRLKGYLNSIYIDDILLTSDNKADLDKNVKQTAYLFDEAGFTIHPKKSSLEGTKVIEFLGFIIDSEAFHVRISEKKSNKIKQMCKDITQKKKVTIRELAEVIGTFVATEPANKFAALYYKRMEIFRNEKLKESKGDYSAYIILSEEILQDLEWWINNIDQHPKPICLPKISKKFKCDASLTGWGIYDVATGETSGGMWSNEEKNYHINCLEIMAIKICLQSFCKDIFSEHIQIYTDNTTAMASVNKMGSTKRKINNIVRDLWLWCKEKDIYLTVSYIEGKKNIEADKASREFNANIEWSLNQRVFELVIQRYGNMDIDLFASRLNHKIEKYISWKPDPMAVYINAWHVEWDFKLGYCFPPFSLIPSVLQKVEEDLAEIVLIAPLWPTQIWFPKLMELLVKDPIILPKVKNMIVNPLISSEGNTIIKKLILIACRLSGKDFKTKAFRQQLQTSYYHHGDQTQSNNMKVILKNGFSSVVKEKVIQFHLVKLQ